jgi:hypothetical protein
MESDLPAKFFFYEKSNGINKFKKGAYGGVRPHIPPTLEIDSLKT